MGSDLERISFLAQPKKSKTVWATTPWTLTWGNQESIRPLSRSALRTVPSPRITALAQHKTDPSLRIQLRKEEEDRRMKISHPSCHAVQYENIVRLATPRIRERSFREVNSPHSLLCEHDCPVWHMSPGVRNVSSRILHLANPKPSHPNFTSDRQNVQTLISYATLTAKMTARLEQLSLPRLRENTHFYDAGRPESPIRPVSRGARKAMASARIRDLSAPKALSKDYIPPREPTWQSA